MEDLINVTETKRVERKGNPSNLLKNSHRTTNCEKCKEFKLADIVGGWKGWDEHELTKKNYVWAPGQEMLWKFFKSHPIVIEGECPDTFHPDPDNRSRCLTSVRLEGYLKNSIEGDFWRKTGKYILFTDEDKLVEIANKTYQDEYLNLEFAATLLPKRVVGRLTGVIHSWQGGNEYRTSPETATLHELEINHEKHCLHYRFIEEVIDVDKNLGHIIDFLNLERRSKEDVRNNYTLVSIAGNTMGELRADIFRALHS